MWQVRFDLLTRATIGLTTLDEVPFCEATLFTIQNRMLSYQVETGTHLLEQVFDSLTAEQLKTLKIKTDLQRCDSLQAESNIRSYSRIQLLIEVLLRVHRVFSDEDRERFKETFAPFEGKTSGQYVSNPENGLQLITDVHVTANNRDDSDELHYRLDGNKEKTPDIAVIHTDGGYGSEKNDIKRAPNGSQAAIIFPATSWESLL
jgi:hypothetical protein